MRRLLVVCVGNRDRGDDAIGRLVADRLRAAPVDGIELLETDGDCAAVGTIHVIDGREESLLPSPGHSTHGLGVAEAIALGRALGALPAALTIFGVEGADFQLGIAVSPAVARAAVEVADRIRQRADRR
jgi:hydrogenase maturation protease